jgi:hypothetical protein
MHNNELVPLTELAHELSKLTGRRPPTYRELWRAVADGELEAERENGRLYVRRQNLPAAAHVFGLMPEVAE